MGSSDEDIPLAQRNQTFMFGKAKPIVLSSDDDSPLPSWLQNHKPAGNTANTSILESDSDSDIKEVISPVKLLSPSKTKPGLPSQAAIEPKPESQPPKTAAPKRVSSQQKPKPKKSTQPDLTSFPIPSLPVSRVAPFDDGAGPSQPPQPPATGSDPPRAFPSGLPVSKSSMIPVMIPDRISQAKVLLELESTGEAHGATDLSGDSGAIGRILVKGQQGSQQLQIDLKGKIR